MSAKTMCCKKDREWLLILKQNKFEDAKTFLQSQDEDERKRLLHSHFVPTKINMEPYLTHSAATYPCFIAAVHGSNEVLEVLFS